MSDDVLFPGICEDSVTPVRSAGDASPVRLRRPDRQQVLLRPCALDELLPPGHQVLAMLMARGLVSVKRISQDGLRVRASAGTSSFKRETKLQEALALAKAHVEALKQAATTPSPARSSAWR